MFCGSPTLNRVSVPTRNHKGLDLARMENATQWDSTEEMAKICHAIMCRGIPTIDRISALLRLCSHEKSQRARSGEYGDCHTVGQF
jgi:hypothetical protein